MCPLTTAKSIKEVDAQSSPPDIVFHPGSAIDATAVAQVQVDSRHRLLRALVGRGLIEQADAKEMLAYQHSGFSVDAGVCIEADDRAALERLLRYCARPPFAMERLRKEGAERVYRCAKQHSEPSTDRASRHGRGRAWGGGAGQRGPTRN